MYVPNSVSTFGSAERLIVIKGKAQGDKLESYEVNLDVKKTHRTHLDKPSERCTKKYLNPNTSACIAEYIQAKIGCSFNIQGVVSSQAPPCNSTEQLKQFRSTSKKLQYADASKIYSMSGCLSSCEKDKYHMEVTDRSSKLDKGNNTLSLTFYIKDSSYTEEEQYIIYDFNSFIADVGGYMGLLLGSSFLSLYDELESCLITFRKKLRSPI